MLLLPFCKQRIPMNLSLPSSNTTLSEKPSGTSQIPLLIILLVLCISLFSTYHHCNYIIAQSISPVSIETLWSLGPGWSCLSPYPQFPAWNLAHGSHAMDVCWETSWLKEYIPFDDHWVLAESGVVVIAMVIDDDRGQLAAAHITGTGKALGHSLPLGAVSESRYRKLEDVL